MRSAVCGHDLPLLSWAVSSRFPPEVPCPASDIVCCWHPLSQSSASCEEYDKVVIPFLIFVLSPKRVNWTCHLIQDWNCFSVNLHQNSKHCYAFHKNVLLNNLRCDQHPLFSWSFNKLVSRIQVLGSILCRWMIPNRFQSGLLAADLADYNWP